MKCLNFHCIFPAHYDRCPVCWHQEYEKKKFAPQEAQKIEVEPISALVITADFEVEDEA